MKLEVFKSSYGYYNLRTIDGNPTEEMRTYLKQNGYYWSSNKNCWYPHTSAAKQANETFVETFRQKFFDPAAQEQKSFGQELFEHEQRKAEWREAHGFSSILEHSEEKPSVDERITYLENLVKELQEERAKDKAKIANLESELLSKVDESVIDYELEQQQIDEEAEWEKENTLTEEEEQEIIEQEEIPDTTIINNSEVMNKLGEIMDAVAREEEPEAERDFSESQAKEDNVEVEVSSEELALAKSVLPTSQYVTTLRFAQGEEGNFFKQKIKDIAEVVQNAPKLYETDGAEQHTIVLRYFHPTGTETLVTEIGEDGEAFGFQCLNGDYEMAEFGYLDLNEIKNIRMMEIDYHVEKGMTVERWLYKEQPDMFPQYAKYAEQPEEKTPFDIAKETGNDVEAISESLGQQKRYYYNPYSQEYFTIAFEDNDWHYVFYDNDYNVLSDDVGITPDSPKNISEAIDTILEMRYHINSFDPDGMSKSEYEATKEEKEHYLSKNWTIWTDVQGFEEIVELKRKAEQEKENKILFLKDVLKNDEELKQSALVNNRQDFANAYYDKLTEILIKEYDNDKSDFVRNLLDSDKTKKEIMGEYIDEVYDTLKLEERRKAANKPYDFFINDSANLDLGIGAEIEPITGLTAEKAALKYAELKDKGLSPYIGINIPGDFVFDDKEGQGAGIFTEVNGHPSFYMGDNFVKDLKEYDEHAKNVIAAYKELYEMTDKYILGVQKPVFLFEKENELSEKKEYDFTKPIIISERFAIDFVNHGYKENTVRFIDRKYKQITTGQYVVSTIANRNGNSGLILDMGITDWTVDAESMRKATEICRYYRDNDITITSNYEEGQEIKVEADNSSEIISKENTLNKLNIPDSFKYLDDDETKFRLDYYLSIEELESLGIPDLDNIKSHPNYKDFRTGFVIYTDSKQLKAAVTPKENFYSDFIELSVPDELKQELIAILENVIENRIKTHEIDSLEENEIETEYKIMQEISKGLTPDEISLNLSKYKESLVYAQEKSKESWEDFYARNTTGFDTPQTVDEFRKSYEHNKKQFEYDVKKYTGWIKALEEVNPVKTVSEEEIAAERALIQNKINQLKEELNNPDNQEGGMNYDERSEAEAIEYVQRLENISDEEVTKMILWKKENQKRNEENEKEAIQNYKEEAQRKDIPQDSELFSYNETHPVVIVTNKETGRESSIRPYGDLANSVKDMARLDSLSEANTVIENIKAAGFNLASTPKRIIIYDNEKYFDFDYFAGVVGKLDNRNLNDWDFKSYVDGGLKITKKMNEFLQIENSIVKKLSANIDWSEFTEEAFNKTKTDMINNHDGEMYGAINVGQLCFELVPQDMGDRMELFTNIYYPELYSRYGEDADGVKYDTATGLDIDSETFTKMSYEEFKEYFIKTVLPSSLDNDLTERALKPTEDWNTIWQKMNEEDNYSYMFPEGFFKDSKELNYYEAEYEGTFDFESDGICQVVSGTKKTLEKIASDYGYELHPDYLYHKHDLNLDDRAAVHDLAFRNQDLKPLFDKDNNSRNTQEQDLSFVGKSFYEWAASNPNDERKLDYVIETEDKIVSRFNESTKITQQLMSTLRNSTFRGAFETRDEIRVRLEISNDSYLLNQKELESIDARPNIGYEQLTSKKDIKAIREQCREILKKPDSEITETDKAILAQYEGAGGLNEVDRTNAGILNEFYTPNNLVNKVWQIVDAYAPNAKTVLEPSAGVGKFANNRPNNIFTMHELDETSARINKILHPEANVIQGAYQKQFFDEGERVRLSSYQQPKYDVVIGNPPYGKYNDKYKGLGEGKEFDRYEEYFISKGLDALKDENSIMAFVVPSGFLNTASDKQKEIISSKGHLIDAYRLPEKTFPTTEVGTDIIIMQNLDKIKKSLKYEEDISEGMAEGVALDELSNGNWFKQHPEKILGEVKTRTNRFGKEEEYVTVHEGLTVQDELNKIDSMLPKAEQNISEELSPADRQPSVESKENEIEESLKAIKELEEKIYKKYIETDIPPVFSDKEGYAHTISHELAEGFIHKNNLGNTVTLRHHLSSTNHNISYKERQLVKEIFEEVTGYYLPAIEEGNETVDSEIKSIIKLWQNGEKQKMEYSSKYDVLAAYHAVITPALEEIYPDDPNKVREETLKFSEAIKTMDFHKLGSFILWTTEREEPVKIAARKVFEEKIGKTFPTFDDVDDSEKRHLTELWFAKQTNAAQKSNYYKMYDLHSEQDVLEYLVSRGTITQGGKERINEFFEKNSKDQERIKFLINEYGWVGSYQGVFSMDCKNDSKGIKVEAYITNPETEEVTKFDKMVSWKDICNEIKRQRLLDIYLDKPVKESVQDQHSLTQTDNKEQAPKVKSPRAKKEKWNIAKSKGEVMSAQEFSRLYGRDFDEREFPIWAATDWQGNIDLSKLNADDLQYMEQSGNYICKKLSSGEPEWTHKVLFTTGDIYAKIEEQKKFLSEAEDNPVLVEMYNKNIELLEASKKNKLNMEHIHFGLKSTLAEEFIIPQYDGDGNFVNLNLQESFILWAQGHTLASRRYRNEIDFATANISREELGEELSFYDIIDYIDGKPVKADAVRGWHTYKMTEEEKKAEKAERKKEADLKRQARADVANKLFDRYLHEGLELETIKQLEEEYNRRFNSYIIPDYSKLPLFVDGMSAYKGDSKFKLYNQQIKGISFLCNKGNGLLAYDVGVGKTAAGIVATVNQIQTERSKRPLIIVPNQVYSKWYTDIKQLFPNVKVNDLYNFNKESVGKYIDPENPHKLNIPENSISLCTYEALKNITFTDESCENELYQDFANLLSADMDGSDRENAESSDKIKGIIGSASHVKDESYYFFEECGFDNLTVDEAHNFKNLWVVPRPKKKGQSNEYAGIPSGKPSARALKMYGMTQLVQQHNDNRNVFMLTATPFTNSPTEVYSMLSYIGRERLHRAGIKSLRSFFDQFAQTKQELGVTSKGEIDTKQVMKNWKELPALQSILTEFIDKVDGEEALIIRPHKFTHVKPLDMSELQLEMREMDEARMAEVKEGNSAAVIVAMNNMRLSCVAPALANPEMYEGLELPPLSQLVETSPKLKFVCDAIIDMYKDNPEKGQFMYVPLGKDSHGIIKDYLVQHGIPKEAVEIINGEINNTPEKKEKITGKFNDVKDKLKIIIGGRNTAEGIDLNGNSFVMYNCSLGWNPSETIQAEGRIWRQNNMQGHVHIVYPVMNDSIDSVLYQKHDEKISRIDELWSYKGDSLNVEDINPEDLKLDLIKDPNKKAKLILEEETKDVKAELSKLNLKIKDFDEIIEKRKQLTLDFGTTEEDVQRYEKQIQDYKDRNLEVPEWIKLTLKNYKKDLEKQQYQKNNIQNKLYSWNLKTEEDEAAYIHNLNEQKKACEEKIHNIEKSLPEILQKLVVERMEQKIMEYPVTKQREILEADILNNLRPMKEVEFEIKTDRHNKMLAEMLKAGDITQEEHDLYKAAGYEKYEKWLNGEIESLEEKPVQEVVENNNQQGRVVEDKASKVTDEYGFEVFGEEASDKQEEIKKAVEAIPSELNDSEKMEKLKSATENAKKIVGANTISTDPSDLFFGFTDDDLFVKSPDNDKDELVVKSPEQLYFNFDNDDSYLTPDQLSKAEQERDKIVLPVLNDKESGMYKAFKDFSQHGIFDIVGTMIDMKETANGTRISPTGWKQLHAAMNIYRNKQFETFRYVLVDRHNGRIKDQLSVCSYMPNVCKVSDSEGKTLENVLTRAEETDCLIVAVHNHPSGNVQESNYDREATKSLEKSCLRNDGLQRFAGHIILDHDNFNIYKPHQGWKVHKDEQRLDVEDELINKDFAFSDTKIHYTGQLLDVAKSINETNNWNDNFVPVLFVNADCNISGLKYYDKSFFNKESQVIRNELQFSAIEAGAVNIFPVVTEALTNKLNGADRFLMEERMKELVLQNIFTDAVLTDSTIVEKNNLPDRSSLFNDFLKLAKPNIETTWEHKINPSLFAQMKMGTLKVIQDEELEKKPQQDLSHLKKASGMGY